MKVEQIYTGCLAQGAYYIESDGEAAIIDPLRETEPYIKRAQKDNAEIKYVFETHFHADFVSGHLDLSKKTGAPIIYGPTATPEFKAHIAGDGEVFNIGKAKIKALHTPGHTTESTCYLLKDENGKDYAIFTGDTLFLGDVGRPDLAQKSESITQEDLAGMLYDSLNEKIMPLADDVIVYPAHGAGSACGKNMMKETVDTLGNQKKMNYALQQPDKKSFVEAVTEGLLAPPAYFPMNVALNKKGYKPLEDVMKKGLKKLSPGEFEAAAESTGAIVLDTRNGSEFTNGFIPRSINIGLGGQFAPWAGALLGDVSQPLLIVAEEGREEETVMRLSRVGFDNVLGCLDGGFEAWKSSGKESDKLTRLSAEEFEKKYSENNITVIDIRREGEYRNSHVAGAYSKPLDFINEWTSGIDGSKPFIIHCQTGYRSMIAGSILKARGIHNFAEVSSGFRGISNTSVPVTTTIEKDKLLQGA